MLNCISHGHFLASRRLNVNDFLISCFALDVIRADIMYLTSDGPELKKTPRNVRLACMWCIPANWISHLVLCLSLRAESLAKTIRTLAQWCTNVFDVDTSLGRRSATVWWHPEMAPADAIPHTPSPVSYEAVISCKPHWVFWISMYPALRLPTNQPLGPARPSRTNDKMS